ncbi:hypothetical protein TNCV_1046711 [Trichonephila clavipes]|nr:hypothetical protein TNCV_1046711 [Trichonephila clavipes]
MEDTRFRVGRLMVDNDESGSVTVVSTVNLSSRTDVALGTFIPAEVKLYKLGNLFTVTIIWTRICLISLLGMRQLGMKAGDLGGAVDLSPELPPLTTTALRIKVPDMKGERT